MESKRLCSLSPVHSKVDCDGGPKAASVAAGPGMTISGIENVPPEKLDAMIAYARQLREKFPHFSEKRLTRKVAEHFKIKLT